MRQLFLTTTLLVAAGVATNAFAFGGIGLGLKSNSHKSSGVDAIGVHINGKGKADIDITDGDSEICPPERQCGDYCCGYDNVCNKETGQCCNSKLCCAANESAFCDSVACSFGGAECCAGPLYCYWTADGVCDAYRCCPAPSIVFKNKGLDGADLCCEQGTEPSCIEYNGDNSCKTSVCCASGLQATGDPEDPQCCSAENGVCCGTQEVLFGETCCPAGSTGVDGEGNCCEAGTKPVLNKWGEEPQCCPMSSTALNDDGECI